MTTPASEIITRLGGPKAIAEQLGITRNAVQRWVYPNPRGHNNRVPQKHWTALVERFDGAVSLDELMTEEVAQIVAAVHGTP